MTLKPSLLNELKRSLLARRSELEGEAHADAEKARNDVYSESAGPVTDPCDEATADLISDIDNAELARDVGELRRIDEALARVDDGSYGRCAGCGIDIPAQRLRLEPTALRCASCEQLHEKTFVQPDRPTL
jgi:RNA polymerase-binding transcription factor DksA